MLSARWSNPQGSHIIINVASVSLNSKVDIFQNWTIFFIFHSKRLQTCLLWNISRCTFARSGQQDRSRKSAANRSTILNLLFRISEKVYTHFLRLINIALMNRRSIIHYYVIIISNATYTWSDHWPVVQQQIQYYVIRNTAHRPSMQANRATH